jgi:putative hydrolase of the HAD superfamily
MRQYVDKIRIYPDVNDILSRLKDKLPIILTSNAGREFIDVEMEATGLGGYFDRIFSATSDFGEVKKTVGFYQRICQIIGVHPQEVVHVGDHFEFDYLVPQSLGINALYLDRSGQKNGEYVLKDLKGLEKRLIDLIEVPDKGDESGKKKWL